MSKEFKVRNSYGIRDAYRWYLKTFHVLKKDFSEKQFSRIVKELNKCLIDKLLVNKEVKLPLRMGKLEVRKTPTYIKIKENKIITNLPIDWVKTLELWENDNESRLLKKLIRIESKEKFILKYNKKDARYKNKCFYRFSFARSLKKHLKQLIGNNEFDTFLV